MGQLPESDIAVQALRRYFGPYPGIVRIEMKVPHIFSLEEPIDSYIPSSLDEVTDTKELLEEIAGPLLKAVQQSNITSISKTVQAFGEEMKTVNESIDFGFTDVFSSLKELDLGKIDEKMLSAGLQLGKRGWLVGPYITPQGLYRALEETDEFMKKHHPVDQLIEMVQESDATRWQKTILEAIHSYRDGRHRVVVLSLLPVIESLARERVHHLVDTDEEGRIGRVNIEALEETEARAEENFHLLGAWEASIASFIKERWINSPNMFSCDPPRLSNIDRNWAVHGKDNPERWDPIDAHRLLQVAAVLAHETRYRSTADES